ncbi:hypothetical protein [Mycobacterium leprae]|nr:hypothetical protein [Mycobacterium leprae]
MDASCYISLVFSMDSAWRGVLSPESGFANIHDVPALVMLDLA